MNSTCKLSVMTRFQNLVNECHWLKDILWKMLQMKILKTKERKKKEEAYKGKQMRENDAYYAGKSIYLWSDL